MTCPVRRVRQTVMWKGYLVAHELLIDGGRAAMFYVGEKPWHGLGTRLDAPPSSEAAIAAAGLDWTVAKVPLYVAAQARLHELRDRFAIVREDKLGSADFPVFGIVGPEYVPLQNREAFAFFDPIVKDGDATYETAGALGRGERIWIQARLSNDIEVAGDVIQRYLLLSNTHNASSSLQVKLTPVRVVCNNTLTVALSKGRSICIRHDHAMDEHLEQAKNLLGLVETEYARVTSTFRRMAARKLTQHQAAAYFAQVFPDSASANPVARQLVANRRRWALHFFHEGEGNSEMRCSRNAVGCLQRCDRTHRPSEAELARPGLQLATTSLCLVWCRGNGQAARPANCGGLDIHERPLRNEVPLSVEFRDMTVERPSLLVLVRHAESARNVAKKGNTFFLDDESRKAVQGVADHHVPITTRAVGRPRRPVVRFATSSAPSTTCITPVIDEHRRPPSTYWALIPQASASPCRSGIICSCASATPAGYDMTTAEAAASFPWLQGYWDTFGRFFARPPGGESLAAVAERVYLFLGMLFRDRAQQRVLVVSHGGTLRVFRYLLERWTHDEFLERWESEPVPNCAVTTYAFDPTAGRLMLQALNRV